MEPTKQAALMVCLQQSQVDLITAKREKDELAKRATAAEAKVAELRDIIHGSGSQNTQRIAELLTELRHVQEDRDIEREANDQLRRSLEVERELYDNLRSNARALCDAYDRLLEKHNGLRDRLPGMLETAKLIDAQRDMFRDRWIDETQRRINAERSRINAERSDRRSKQYLARARKSRNKAQRRLYTLRKKMLQLQAANN